LSRVLIETPDSVAASLLQRRLQIEMQLVRLPGRCELRCADIRLAELAGVLSAVERWMADVGLASVAVRLDERRYVLISDGSSRGKTL
jgi:hypothetical protein